MATDKELGEVFTLLANAYPNYELPMQSVALYAEEWRRLEGKLLKIAARLHIRRSKFYPAIAEVLELAAEIERDRLRKAGEQEVMSAIQAAKRAALPKQEARKMLTALTEAAGQLGDAGKKGTALARVLGGPWRTFHVGGSDTDAEWHERKRKAKT